MRLWRMFMRPWGVQSDVSSRATVESTTAAAMAVASHVPSPGLPLSPCGGDAGLTQVRLAERAGLRTRRRVNDEAAASIALVL
ncbi:hypothetical protein DDD63_01795 [Actinobaculum sp. 313]|nr:hypothetical protein DDD63_01795 [Actinobaculum sp. 313]